MAAAQDVSPFEFPKYYFFPPMWTIQPTLSSRLAQFKRWSQLILSYSRHYRLFRMTIVDALETPLFNNAQIRKRMTTKEVREILDWMASEEGDRRAEWVDKEGEKANVWVYWRRPEEWATLIESWVEETGQKGVVLTLYELTEGESTTSQDFHGMDPDLLQKTLQVIVRRNKAQIFGNDDSKGIKFI